MASLTHDLDTPLNRPDGPVAVVRVGRDRVLEGVARLLGDRAGGGQTPAEFVKSADEEGLDLSLMWAAVLSDGRLGETALVTLGVGRTASVFTSGCGGDGEWAGPVGGPSRRAQRAAVLRTLTAWLAGPGAAEVGEVHLVQSLVEPKDEHLIPSFEDAGFARLAELGYMRRELPAKAWGGGVAGGAGGVAFPEGVRVMSLAELERPLEVLREAMERSYIGTLDCPALCGMREPGDVLESHLAVGEHDTRLWYVVFDGARPEGCMLLSPCPAQHSVELVYIGLGPGLRGRGVGRTLLEMAAQRLAGRRETSLACAVDLANAPALKLYKGAKFRQFATRTALVKSLRK